MDTLRTKPDLEGLAAVLSGLCDSWLKISEVMKDHPVVNPPSQSDEIQCQVERQLARIKEKKRAFLD